MKICRKCNIEKQDTDFFQSQLIKKYSVCKSCLQIYYQKYRSKNKETLNSAQKERYRKNKEYYSNRNKQYRQNNKEKVKEINKRYQEETQYNKKYYLQNKDILKLKKRKYVKNRYQNDIKFKLRILLSRSINMFLRAKGLSKDRKSILKYLPYSIENLIHHIEKQFEPWMSWNNHGNYNCATWRDNDQSTWTWQIDHIIPHNMFQYNSMDDIEFKECWALDNLRPLSSKENLMRLRKSI